MLQSCIAVRISVAGDGVSDVLKLDFKKVPVQLGEGEYGLVPGVPNSIVSILIGGPTVSPESGDFITDAELDGSTLIVNFGHPLIISPNHYLIELVLGYNAGDKQGLAENKDIRRAMVKYLRENPKATHREIAMSLGLGKNIVKAKAEEIGFEQDEDRNWVSH